MNEVRVTDEAAGARSHDAVGIPIDSVCPARHPASRALCIESPGHEGEHRAMGVSRLQWFGVNLRESECAAAAHLITTNNTGYFWCSCSPTHARVFRGLREHIVDISSRAQPLVTSRELNRHDVWRAVYDAAIAEGLQPSGVADRVTDAVLALAEEARNG